MFKLTELNDYLHTLPSERAKKRLLIKLGGGDKTRKIEACKLAIIDSNTDAQIRDTATPDLIQTNTLRSPITRQSIRLLLLVPVDSGSKQFRITRLDALIRKSTITLKPPAKKSGHGQTLQSAGMPTATISTATISTTARQTPKLSLRDQLALQYACNAFITSKLKSLMQPKPKAPPLQPPPLKTPRRLSRPTLFEMPMQVLSNDEKVHLNRRKKNEFVELAKWCFKNIGSRLEVIYEDEAGRDANGPVRDALTAALNQLEQHGIVRFDRTTELFELHQPELSQGNVNEKIQKFEALGHLLGRAAILNSHNENFTTSIPLSKTLFDVIVKLNGASAQFADTMIAHYLFGRPSMNGQPLTAAQAVSSLVETKESARNLSRLLAASGMPVVTTQSVLTHRAADRWIHKLNLNVETKHLIKTLCDYFSADSAKSLAQRLGGWLIPKMVLSKGYHAATSSFKALSNDITAEAIMQRVGIVTNKSLTLELQEALAQGKSGHDFFSDRFAICQ